MVSLLYSFGIRLYALGVRVAALWNTKARQMAHGWKDTKKLPPLDGRTAWFHASSLGEFEQARPVLEAFKGRHPEYKICVTFFSPSGFEIRKDYKVADRVCYLPMDTPANARNFVRQIQPTVAFFVKYDFWFNYLGELKKNKVPTYIFSAIFRPSHYFFKPYGRWFLKQLHCFDHLFVQNDESLRLLQSHGVNHCSIAGDTRFDRVKAIADKAQQFPEIERFIDHENAPGTRVLIAGSSWEPDEEHLRHLVEDLQMPHLKVILAPHVIEESHLCWIEQHFGTDRCLRYSQLKDNADAPCDRPVLIIDNIGMLSALYRYADIAYIGGGWGHGIHNILEAITFGKPVVFGPRYQKFKEAHDIIAKGGGWGYKSYDELKAIVVRLLTDADHYSNAVGVCQRYVSDNIGCTTTILDKIEPRH